MARLLFIEPFHGGSHRAFADGLAARSRHEVELLALPGRNWKWRMRGAAPLLAEKAAALPGGAELLFASSMLNLAEFRGLAPRRFARLPAILYFHENQLTYPLPEREKRDLHFALIQVTSLLAADRVLFNSEHHRREFRGALPGLLAALPDHKPRAALDRLDRLSSVTRPGVERPPGERRAAAGASGGGEGRTIVWNHRWEHDKGPDRLLALVRRLRERGTPFRLVVTGAGHRERADVFAQLPDAAGPHLAHVGFVENRDEYGRLLHGADIVLSTARHEFFGISVLEAVMAGAFPVLPRALSYPELLDPERFRESYYDSFDGMVEGVERALRSERLETGPLRREAERYSWGRAIDTFDDLIDETAVTHRESGGGGSL